MQDSDEDSDEDRAEDSAEDNDEDSDDPHHRLLLLRLLLPRLDQRERWEVI